MVNINEPLIVTVKGSQKAILKTGFMIQGILMIVCVLFFVVAGILAARESLLLGIILIAIGIVVFFVSKRYLSNVFMTERIVVTPEKIKVVIKTWAEEKIHEFSPEEINYFGHVGTVKYTEHTMNNNIVDFTGLGTGEKELQYLIDEGTIEIRTNSKVLRFGKNMTSWDTEEVVEEVEQYLGVKFGKETPVEAVSDYSEKFSLRPYETSDLDALTEVFKLNVPKYFAAKELDEFLDYLEKFPETYLVMEMNGGVIGGVGYEVREEDASGRINWVFLNPAYTKSGYGKKACEYCIDILKRSPQVKVLVVRTSQFAYEFFKRLGYNLIEVKNDYWAPELDLYLMERELDKSVNVKG